MSDIMKSIPFGQLMEWILAEHKETGQVFGIQKAYVADPSKTVETVSYTHLDVYKRQLLFMGKCASVRAAERLRFFRSWIWELLCMIP